VPDGPLLTGGGWARSESFLRLRASLLGRTIQRVEEAELTAYGAALLAAGAAGCMPPLALETKLIEPDPGWASAYAAREPAAMRGKVAT
jgi:xylulokinase